MPSTTKPNGVNSLKTSQRRKCTRYTQRKRMSRSRSKSMRPRRGHRELYLGKKLHSKSTKQEKSAVSNCASMKKTNYSRPSTSNYNKNANRKHASRTVKNRKDLFIHQKPKKMLIKTKNNTKTRKSTSKNFPQSSHSSHEFVQELKTLLMKTLTMSQPNNYTQNQYRNNDIDRVHLTSLIQTISYPKFVYGDLIEQDSDYLNEKEYSSEKCEPFENELNVVSWWAKNKGITSKMKHSKIKTYPKKYSNDFNKVHDPSPPDYCYAKSSNMRFCKTQSELNAMAHSDKGNCLSTISKNKLICNINKELEIMKNDQCGDYLLANPVNVATIYETSNDYSDARELELNIDDYADNIFTNAKIEMKNEFVKACDLVFDTFKEKVFDTVYSNYVASCSIFRRMLHN